MGWVQTLQDARKKKKGQRKLCLSAIFSSGYRNAEFFRWHDSSMQRSHRRIYRRLQMVSKSVWYSWYLKLFSHTSLGSRNMTGKKWMDTNEVFRADRCGNFTLRNTFQHQQREKSHHKWDLRMFRFPWSHECAKWQKCVGSLRACCWVVSVSTDMLFLQDPLGSCKGNESVIRGLELIPGALW